MFIQLWNCYLGRKIFFSTFCLYVIGCHLCDAQCPSDCLCNWKGRVNCDSVGIREVPSDLPAKANVLLLSNNFIDVINEETLQGMQDILEMQLEGNLIQWIPAYTFSYCTNLVKLNISSNKISSLQKEVFVGLNDLEVLDLGSNNIDEIHPSALRPLNNLQELNLYDNSLRHLTEGIFRNFKHLRLLNLGKSKIKLSSPRIFQGLGNLTLLNLGENANLNSLPKGIFHELPSLKFLDLQGCGFQTLSPSMFEGLTILEEINLQGNKLQNTLPLQLFSNMPNLASLNIDNNYLMTLHESVLSSNKHLTKVYLNGNNWQCSCSLLNVRARWPQGKPAFMPHGLTCKGPVTLKPPRDLWNISLEDLQDQCMVEIGNTKMVSLPHNYSDELHLDCPVPQTGVSIVDWITPDGQYLAANSGHNRYILFDNGTLYMSGAQSGLYMCSVTAPTGESSRAFLRVTFDDAIYGSPVPVTPTDPKENSHHSNTKAFLVPAIIISIIVIIAVIVVWLRWRRAKRPDKLYNSPFKHPEHVKNLDHAYAYAYISVPDGKAKKKRDISAYAINALFEFKLPDLPEFHKGYGYDQIQGRPKSHSCRERTSKYSPPEPIPRPSHTLDSRASRGTSRAESCAYITPSNGGGIGMFFSATARKRSSDPEEDMDMDIPLYGFTRMNDNDDMHDKGLKCLRELQSINGCIRPKSNPYIELIA